MTATTLQAAATYASSTAPSAAPSPAGTQEILIQRVTFTAPAPYTEGHVLTAAEAVALNLALANNLRNNFAKVVQAAQEVATASGGAIDRAALQDEFNAYASTYTFRETRASRVQLDATSALARRIARDLVIDKMHKDGQRVKDTPNEEIEARITDLLAKKPGLYAEAERRIAALRDIGLANLGFDE